MKEHIPIYFRLRRKIFFYKIKEHIFQKTIQYDKNRVKIYNVVFLLVGNQVCKNCKAQLSSQDHIEMEGPRVKEDQIYYGRYVVRNRIFKSERDK